MFDQVLWTLDRGIEAFAFEALCVDLLCREDYRHIAPIGGTKDAGRDAEVRVYDGRSGTSSIVLFFFSTEARWEPKLRRDVAKAERNHPGAKQHVFVTTQAVSGAKQNALRKDHQAKLGVELTIYGRDWLAHRLVDLHPDLAKKHLGLNLPTTLNSEAAGYELPENDDDTSLPYSEVETVRAIIANAVRKEPTVAANWKRLANFEFRSRNYDTALRAVNRGLELDPTDPNLMLSKAVILAENGIEKQSRPLLVQAEEMFRHAAERLGRSIDHYNLANALGALGEIAAAERHYRRALEIEPTFAQAWKNLGSVLLRKREVESAFECFDKAIELKPRLVEAHVCKATAELLFRRNANQAVASFQKAYSIDAELDQRFRNVRYWFSRALAESGELQTALQHVEIELLNHPDDTYLLNAKAGILHRLWKREPMFAMPAIEFMNFRARCLPNDYAGLAELIELCTFDHRDEPWAQIDANLSAGGVPISEIARRSGVTLSQVRDGLNSAPFYRSFRDKFSVDAQFAILCGHGLSPDSKKLGSLNHVLMVPFAVALDCIRKLDVNGPTEPIQSLFDDILEMIARVFAAYGAHWLAHEKPASRDEQANLLTLGVIHFSDVIIAESCRHVAYIAGYLGFPKLDLSQSRRREWKDFSAEAGARLAFQVFADWEMKKDKPNDGKAN